MSLTFRLCAPESNCRVSFIMLFMPPACAQKLQILLTVTPCHVCSKRLLFVAYAQGAQAEAYTGQQSAALATQKILEWPRLCSHVAKFASTTLGRQAVLELKASILIACIRLHTAAPAGNIPTSLFSCARCSAVADRKIRESICSVWTLWQKSLCSRFLKPRQRQTGRWQKQ